MKTLFFILALLHGTAANCGNLTKEEIVTLVKYEAYKQGVDEAVALAIVEQESSFRPAVERYEPKFRTWSVGLFAIFIPAAKRLGVKRPTREMLKNPEVNIKVGIAHIKECMARFGTDPKLIACCHNAGPYVKKSFCSNYAWTRQYVKEVSEKVEVWQEKLNRSRSSFPVVAQEF